jgi:hypothetical protein
MSKFSSPLAPGDDIHAWLTVEIPMWKTFPVGESMWRAVSPSYGEDGIQITAITPEELVERVRAIERMIAIVMGVGGSLPVGREIAGQDLREVRAVERLSVAANAAGEQIKSLSADLVSMGGQFAEALTNEALSLVSPPVAPTPEPEIDKPLSPAEMVAMVKLQGFSGDPCPICGSMMMVRTGACLCCQACGATTSCS